MDWRAALVTFARSRLAAAAALAAAALSLLAASAPAAVETVTLQAAADTYLRSGAPDTNEGGSSFLRLRASGDNRALVRFDQAALQAAVGSGTLVSASLELQITGNGDNWGSTGRTISAYRLAIPWAEGNGFVDQGSPPSRGTGSGATWACAADSDISDQGQDCAGSTAWEMGQPNQPQLHPWVEPATATTLITNGLAGKVSFDVTADVQAFLAGTANHGWILKKDVEGAAGLIELASRESGSGGPRLVLSVDAASGPPVNVTAPVVSGEPQEESTLTASSGGWTGSPAIDLQWQRCSVYSEAVTAADPIAWWRLSESGGTTLADVSGYQNNGSYPAGVTLGVPGAVAGLAGGDVDTGASFDGTGSAVVPPSDTLDALVGDFTIETWVRPGSNASSVPLLAKAAADGTTVGDLPALLYGVVLDAGGTVSMRLRLVEDGDGDEIGEEGLDELPDITRDVMVQAPLAAGPSGWSHVAATYDGTAMRIYVNGALAASQPAEGVVESGPEQPVTIAGLQSSFYTGALDEMALYAYSWKTPPFRPTSQRWARAARTSSTRPIRRTGSPKRIRRAEFASASTRRTPSALPAPCPNRQR